jgi:ABC-type uncharacterized transport system permease subunit
MSALCAGFLLLTFGVWVLHLKVFRGNPTLACRAVMTLWGLGSLSALAVAGMVLLNPGRGLGAAIGLIVFVPAGVLTGGFFGFLAIQLRAGSRWAHVVSRIFIWILGLGLATFACTTIPNLDAALDYLVTVPAVALGGSVLFVLDRALAAQAKYSPLNPVK